MLAILNFWSDLSLVVIAHGRRKQVLSGTVQGADHFPRSLVMERVYEFHLGLRASVPNNVPNKEPH